HRHEEVALADLAADLLVPRVTAGQIALVVPDLETVPGQSVAEAQGGLAVLRGIAQKDGRCRMVRAGWGNSRHGDVRDSRLGRERSKLGRQESTATCSLPWGRWARCDRAPQMTPAGGPATSRPSCLRPAEPWTRASCFLRYTRPLWRFSAPRMRACSPAPTCPSAAALASRRSTCA